MKDLSCIICDSKDFDLTAIRHPVTKKQLGVTYCCKECRPKLLDEIKFLAKVALIGCEAIQKQDQLEILTNE